MGLLVLPIFAVFIATGVESWRWRIIFSLSVLIALKFLGPAWVAVPVALIIGIAFRNSLDNIRGSSV